MGEQVINFESVIKDLERRRADMNARFDSAIAAMRQIQAMESAGAVSTSSPSLPFAVDGRVFPPYRNMPMVKSAIDYIKSVGHPVPNQKLAQALEAGGFPHKSKNFANTLNSILWRRSKSVGDFKKTSEGWTYVGD